MGIIITVSLVTFFLLMIAVVVIITLSSSLKEARQTAAKWKMHARNFCYENKSVEENLSRFKYVEDFIENKTL